MRTPTSPAWATQSSKPRDPAAADPAPGPARVLRLLDAARPADVAGVLFDLATLPASAPENLIHALRAVALPLAPAVAAGVLAGRPSAAREVLACRLVQQPECVPARTPALAEYLSALDEAEAAADNLRHLTVLRLRTTALDALRAGTLTAEQVVEHTRPALLTVALGVCTPEEYVQPGARRATGDMRVLIRDRLLAELDTDPDRWSAVLNASGRFGGTLPELLRSRESAAASDRRTEPVSGFRDFFGGLCTQHNPHSLLLGLAPRAVAARYLESIPDLEQLHPRPSLHRWEWLLGGGPLTRPLVDHVLTRGLAAQRRWLARNELSPDSVLEHIAPGHAAEVLLRRVAPPLLRRAAFRSLKRDSRELGTWTHGITGEHRDQVLDLVWELTDDAVLLRQVITAVASRLDEPALLCAYGALAFASGPEPVWALELQRTGSLDAALPAVRDSLLTGSAGPLIDAALQVPRRHWLDTLSDEDHRYQALRTEAELDRTGHFPREELVAAQLDGRPDRWREVVRRLAAGTAAPVEAVIREVAGLVRTPVVGVARVPGATPDLASNGVAAAAVSAPLCGHSRIW
ncbi:MAG: hypothetical protein HOV87_05480 [Catenulispora sp.]|nr:hypothetical protein [Catenulispora sp.]